MSKSYLGNLIILSMVFLLSARASHSLSIECPSFIEEVEDERSVIEKFRSALSSDSVSSLHQNCPELLIKRGYLDAAEFLFQEWFLKRKIDIVDYIQASINYVKNELDRTVNLAMNFKKKQK